MLLLNVVTPVTRPKLLPEIEKTLKKFKRFKVKWYIGLENNIEEDIPGVTIDHKAWIRMGEESKVGSSQRNEALEMITEGLVYFLDDDNNFHADFEETLYQDISDHPDKKGFVYGQMKKDGSHRLDAHKNMGRGGVDTGQFVFYRDFIGTTRWDNGHYDCDGIFFNAVVHEKRDQVLFSEKLCTYYNFLR